MTASEFIKTVKHGDAAIVRFSTRDTADGLSPDWSTPTKIELYVQRREKASKGYPKGQIVTITPIGINWAEYSEQAWCPSDLAFISENYRMEIQKLNGEDVICD